MRLRNWARSFAGNLLGNLSVFVSIQITQCCQGISANVDDESALKHPKDGLMFEDSKYKKGQKERRNGGTKKTLAIDVVRRTCVLK